LIRAGEAGCPGDGAGFPFGWLTLLNVMHFNVGLEARHDQGTVNFEVLPEPSVVKSSA
jgi:hypothetical protein